MWSALKFREEMAQAKTADGVMNTLLGGLPYAHGVQAAMNEHPELSPEQQSEIGGDRARPFAARARAIPYQLAGTLGGLALGGFAGHEFGGMLDHGSLGAGLGALGGGAAGAIGSGIYGRFNEGKNLTEESIGELDKPEGERTTTTARHPIATAAGVPLAVGRASGEFLAAPMLSAGATAAKTMLAPKTAEAPASPAYSVASPYTAHAGMEEAAREEGVNPRKIHGDRLRNLPLDIASVLVPTATAIGGGLLGEHFGPDLGVSPIVGAGGGAALGSALAIPMVRHMGKAVGKARVRQLEN